MRRYTKYKEHARALVRARLEFYNQFYNYKIGRISIRDQKRRWGSCSSKGNLNFNYRIIFLPPELVDYIIVHELCHLGELNHSPRFWALVEKQCPQHIKMRTNLNKINLKMKNFMFDFPINHQKEGSALVFISSTIDNHRR